MITNSQKIKATLFQNLHRSNSMLVLPNAWDITSAKIFELSGYKAIGTTSAGISSALGFPDGQHIDIKPTSNLVSRICQFTDLPVTADIESGYSELIEGVVQNVKEVIKAGAVGINIEDFNHDGSNSLFDLQYQKEKISAIRELSVSLDFNLFINARIDVFLISRRNTNIKLSQTIKRANAYLEAGADGIFVPDLDEFNEEIITSLVKNIHAPLNIIAGFKTLPVSKLEEIGVARVSLGPRPMRVMLHALSKLSDEILGSGTFNGLDSGPITYSVVNNWFKTKSDDS